MIAKGQPVAEQKSGSRRNFRIVALGAAAAGLLGRFLGIVRGSRFGAEGRRKDRGVDALRGFGLGAFLTPRATAAAGSTYGALFGNLALLEEFGSRRFLRLGLMAVGIAIRTIAVRTTIAAAFAGLTILARLAIRPCFTILPGFAIRTGFTILTRLTVLTRLAIIAVTTGFLARLTLVARLALLRAIVALLLVAAIAFAFEIEIIVVAVDVVARTRLRTLVRIRLLEARAGFAQHPEIVIRELQIIFGVDPIALHLRIARKVLVFLEQLRRVAAGTIVDAVAIALVGAATLALLTTTAATAAVVSLTIVHQGLYVLST